MEWRGIEIHPDTPPQGRPLTELFPPAQISSMMQHLRTAGAPFGIAFADRSFLSNSRNALLAAEFSREHGRFAQFHSAVFSAYFSLGLDIGDLDILAQLAQASGLDPERMKREVRAGTHRSRLDLVRQEAGLLEISGVPAFAIEDRQLIVGAQPLDVFRKALRSR